MARPVLTASLLIVAAVAFIVRMPFLGLPLDPDESGYAVGAYWWARGDTLYSAALWFDRPQGIFVVYRAGMSLLGEGEWGIRAWGALWMAAAAPVVLALAHRLTGAGPTAVIAGLTMAVASSSPFVDGFSANAEAFMVPTVTLAALLIWRGDYRYAGLTVGLAIVLKPSGGAGLILGALWLVQSRAPLRSWAWFIAGVFVPLTLALAHGVATVGLGTYLDAAAGFRLTHPVDRQWLAALSGGIWSAPLWAPLLAGGMLGRRWLAPEASRFCTYWLLTSVLGVALGGNWYSHYFIQLVPPLAVLFAVQGWHTLEFARPAYKIAWILAAVLIASGVFYFSVVDPYDGATAGRTHPLIGAEIASYIRDNSADDAWIYVAFSDPRINYLAKRRSAVPWLYPHPLDQVPGAFDALLASIRNGVPDFVAVMEESPPHKTSDEEFASALSSRYVLDAEFAESRVYRRADK
jgi:4-amino-4-deoxy-L-arabinose transferase-like glycosyltransferase